MVKQQNKLTKIKSKQLKAKLSGNKAVTTQSHVNVAVRQSKRIKNIYIKWNLLSDILPKLATSFTIDVGSTKVRDQQGRKILNWKQH